MSVSKRYRRIPSSLFVLFLVAGFSCQEPPKQPAYHSYTIIREDLPSVSEDRTYFYRSGITESEAESLFMALWEEGIPVSRGWFPLDNQCEDPIGPRFTVELHQPDSSITDYQFDPGTDRLFCASQLKQYVITEWKFLVPKSSGVTL